MGSHQALPDGLEKRERMEKASLAKLEEFLFHSKISVVMEQGMKVGTFFRTPDSLWEG